MSSSPEGVVITRRFKRLTKYTIKSNSAKAVPIFYVDHCASALNGGYAIVTEERAVKRTACFSRFQFALAPHEELVFSVEEIHKGNKAGHLRNIAQATGIELERMLFFDNERGNCRDVAPLGVTCCYCPDGVTAEIWRLALENFPAPRGKMVGPQGVCAP